MARMTAAQQAEYNKIEALRDIDYAEYLDQMEDFLARMEYRNPTIREGERVIPTTLEEVVARLNFCEKIRTAPHSADYVFTIENDRVWVESLYDGERWAKRSLESALADLTHRCAGHGRISENIIQIKLLLSLSIPHSFKK